MPPRVGGNWLSSCFANVGSDHSLELLWLSAFQPYLGSCMEAYLNFIPILGDHSTDINALWLDFCQPFRLGFFCHRNHKEHPWKRLRSNQVKGAFMHAFFFLCSRHNSIAGINGERGVLFEDIAHVSRKETQLKIHSSHSVFRVLSLANVLSKLQTAGKTL